MNKRMKQLSLLLLVCGLLIGTAQIPAMAAEVREYPKTISATRSAYSETDLLFELERRVKAALLSGETEVEISDIAIACNEYPFVFLELTFFSPYFSNGIDISSGYSNETHDTKILIQNTMTLAETASYIQSIDEKVDDALQRTAGITAPEQKALVIHDYLVNEFAYDYDNYLDNTVPWDSYKSGGLFMKEHGVCQSYAYIYKYLMNRLGIECHVTSSKNMKHAWNIIKINGFYYHVDCTWDDPVPDSLGLVRHAYFLLSDEAIKSKKHYGWDLTNYICNDTSYDHAYWENVTSPIIIHRGNAYYIADRSIYSRNLEDGTTISWKDLGTWNVWDKPGYFWTTAYSGLFLHEGKLYYNTPTEIKRISINGGDEETVYTPDTSQGYIYGCRKHGHELQYIIATGPSSATSQITEKRIPFSSFDAEITDCQIIFEANGGAAFPLSKKVTMGSAYGDLPTPSRDGYQFLGWYTSMSGGTRVTASTAVTTADDHRLYAHWEKGVIELQAKDITVSNLIYNGKRQAPIITITHNGKLLREGMDYILTGAISAVDAGTHEFTVNGVNNYSGTVSGSFTIAPAELQAEDLSTSDLTYNGQLQTPSIQVTHDGVLLKEGVDYTLTGSTSVVKAGTYEFAVTGINNYTGTINGSFTIRETTKIELFSSDVTVSDLTYNGKPQSPSIKVTHNGVLLKEGVDYTLSGSTSATNAGTYYFTVTGINNYTGTISGSFKIQEAKKIYLLSKDVTVSELIYNGKPQSPSIQVTHDGELLKEGVDYTLSGNTSATNAGTYYFTVTGINDYTGTIFSSFKISNSDYFDRQRAANAKREFENYFAQYEFRNGMSKADIEQAIKGLLARLEDPDVKAELGNDYMQTDATQLSDGSVNATIAITCGSATENFWLNLRIERLPEEVQDQSYLLWNEVVKLKGLDLLPAKGNPKSKKSLTLKWSRAVQADGYEVYWSYCSTPQNYLLLKQTTKLSATHTKMNSKKNYLYYVLAYRFIDGKKVYIAKSPAIHVAMPGNKRTNVKSIAVPKTRLTLYPQQTYWILPTATVEERGKKVLQHVSKFRYFTTDPNVAKVNRTTGKISAQGQGSCDIYVVANNGVYKKIKVTVK